MASEFKGTATLISCDDKGIHFELRGSIKSVRWAEIEGIRAVKGRSSVSRIVVVLPEGKIRLPRHFEGMSKFLDSVEAYRPSAIADRSTKKYLDHEAIRDGFEFAKTFAGRSQEDVFSAVNDWLKKEGAKIPKSQMPSHLRAVHGSYMKSASTYQRDAKKVLDFSIAAQPDGNIAVRVSATPKVVSSEYGLASRDEVRRGWTRLIEECWSAIDPSLASHSFERDDEGIKEKKREVSREGRRYILWGGIVFAFGLALLITALATGVPSDGQVKYLVAFPVTIITVFGGAVLAVGIYLRFWSR